MELSGGHGAQSVFVNASSLEKNLSEIRLFDNGIPFSSSSTAPFGAHQEFNIGRHKIFAEIIAGSVSSILETWQVQSKLLFGLGYCSVSTDRSPDVGSRSSLTVRHWVHPNMRPEYPSHY